MGVEELGAGQPLPEYARKAKLFSREWTLGATTWILSLSRRQASRLDCYISHALIQYKVAFVDRMSLLSIKTVLCVCTVRR